MSEPRVAVVLPCYNEAAAITLVIEEFQRCLPGAPIYVFDNNSRDDSAALARRAGATVIPVGYQGKGNVVRRMFADVDADVYVMVDGDATNDATHVRQHVQRLWTEKLDMIVGRRIDEAADAATYRAGHRLGNRVLTGSVAGIFGGAFTDMLSGYRVFSRRFAKTFPAHSRGFEIETELTVHALELRMPCAEVDTIYRARPEGSHSKLSTYRDGWRILKTIGKLFVSERPLAFFGLLAAALVLLGLALAVPVLLTYLATGLVPRLPTAVLAMGLVLSGMLSLVCGAVLHTVTLGRLETRRLAYLAMPAPGHPVATAPGVAATAAGTAGP